jgi:hypothetical protein
MLREIDEKSRDLSNLMSGNEGKLINGRDQF